MSPGQTAMGLGTTLPTERPLLTASEGTGPAHTLTSHRRPPERGENGFRCSQPPAAGCPHSGPRRGVGLGPAFGLCLHLGVVGCAGPGWRAHCLAHSQLAVPGPQPRRDRDQSRPGTDRGRVGEWREGSSWSLWPTDARGKVERGSPETRG